MPATTDKLERRSTRLMRVSEPDKPARIVGYPAVFNKMSEDLGFRERILPGEFTKTLADGADVRALVDHDPGRIIGRSKAGTLKLVENTRGLKAIIKPADTSAGRDIVESIRRGDVDGMSFAFRTIEDRWHKEDGEDVRELVQVELFDVSVVSFPAYLDTSVGLRSLDDWWAQSGGGDNIEVVNMRLQVVELDSLIKSR